MARPKNSTQNKKSSKKSGRPRSHLSPAKVKVKRKQWSEDSMLAAIMSVREGTPLLRAAKLHGVPPARLYTIEFQERLNM